MLSLMTRKKLWQLRQLCKRVKMLDGDCAELGVFQGGSALRICEELPNKVVRLFDTFSGIPESCVYGKHKQGDHSTTHLALVEQVLAGKNYVIHQGFFPDTATGEKFCFVHLDGDTYQSTKAGIDYFLPRLVPGGIMLFDDYGIDYCAGVKIAIEESGIEVVETVKGQAYYTCPRKKCGDCLKRKNIK